MDKEKRRRVEELIHARQVEEDRIKNLNLSDVELEERKLVEVVPNNILPSDLSSLYPMVPYKVRRNNWGSSFSVGYVMYSPTSYNSDYADLSLISFENLYGDGGIIELSYNYKLNFSLGSLGAEAAYGFYNKDSDDTSFGSLNLNLQQIRLGLRFVLDNFGYEPVIAPYAGAGVYAMIFKETNAGDSFGGQTDPALYVYGGLMFQLDWIDKDAAVEAYSEGGIENTFVYLEGRQYMASSTAQDPDFSTDISVSAGMTVEF